MRKSCLSGFYLLLIFAVSDVYSQIPVITEDFNGAGIPAGWSKFNTSTGGIPAEADWTLRVNGYNYTSTFLNDTFHSNDLSQFYLSNSDAQGDIPAPYSTNTILQCPTFSTLTYSNLTLKFFHNFWSFGSLDYALVEVSTDGTNWIPVYTAHDVVEFEIGASDNFVLQTVNLNAYINNPSVSIRFHYLASFGYYWAIDNVSVIGNSPLSVNLLSFSGYRDGINNILKWTTTNEQNNRGFQIERSIDGINYSSAGFVNSLAPSGNSSGALHYVFTDNNVTGNKQFYRLRQFDFDGREKLHPIILIKGATAPVLTIHGVSPNPANSTINVMFNAPKHENILLMITDITGRRMFQNKKFVEAGSNTIPIDITNLANGIYYVKMISANGEVSGISKFIKQ